MNTTEATKEGELRKQAGLARAADRTALVWQTQLAFLDAIRRAPNQTATLDAAVADLGEKFANGGKWRGAAVRQLAEQGLDRIRHRRRALHPDAARHRGYLTRWRAVDVGAIAEKIAELRRLLAALEQPEVKQPELFQ